MEQSINFLLTNGNWVDLGFLLLIGYFILATRGFVENMFDTIAMILSFIISYKFYSLIGDLLISYLILPRGIAYAIGFFIIWIIFEGIFHILTILLSYKFFTNLKNNRINTIFSFIPAIFQSCLVFLFLVSFIFAFPVRGNIKRDVLLSRSGIVFVSISQSLESKIKNVFGEAINETINFLTIKPESNQVVSLGFQVPDNQLFSDFLSENQMLESVNKERMNRGLNALIFDNQLRDVARSYGKEMFIHGFFAHISDVDGSTPAERADRFGIEYLVIGENLAYAPDVYIAHQGLMNSPGHKANILSPDYNRIGIGVIDGGIYGKMFVQEFTN